MRLSILCQSYKNLILVAEYSVSLKIICKYCWKYRKKACWHE